jgi:N-acetylmuramic acid 6-phosphate (MurNAc-6-P) etherase
MSSLSITETPNELTTDIDVASPEGIVRLLRASDSQIYNGYRTFPALCDDEIIAKMVRVVEWAAPLMGREDAVIVISGAGTSGRLAMFVTRTFNGLLAKRKRTPNFRYLMAGGNKALIKAQEGAEDDPHQAWTDLQAAIDGKKRVLYIGVTCGFSAPYIGGQLLKLSNRKGARSVLLGFNPEERARDAEVENWDKTFADVVRLISRKDNCVILNPVVGPEPITGSTRMKGGSATKLMLETIFALVATKTVLSGTRRQALLVADAVRAYALAYEQTREVVYNELSDIAELVAVGGQTLRSGGHIYYVGSGSPGILGIVDASECPPTFGAAFEDVRGHIVGGWETLLGPGHDMSDAGPYYRISLDDFLREGVPKLTRKDLVVGIGSDGWHPKVSDALRRSAKASAGTACISVGPHKLRQQPADVLVHIPEVPESIVPGFPIFEEYATKLVLNALTTGAHVLCGKVYQNRMVDLRISNNKLYYRTLGIIQHIMGVSPEKAKRCLLRAIFQTDRLTPAMLNARPSRYVEAATNVTKVVPKALVMAGGHVTYAEAERMIRKEPIVRAAIEKLKT